MIQKILSREIGDVKVNVIFIGEKRMRTLNKNYRFVDSSTDVLSFVYKDEDLYAEVFVCPYAVKKNSLKYKQPFERELFRVLIHSCLHIAGYEHEMKDVKSKEMFEKQEHYLKEVELDDRSPIQGS